MSDDVSCTGTSTTLLGRVYGVREETALRDGSQKTKTQAVAAVGCIAPEAEGDKPLETGTLSLRYTTATRIQSP